MRNCGVSSSIQSRCKAVGAEIHSSLVKRQLKNIQDRNDYHIRLPGHSRFVPMNVHRLRYMIHTCCIQLNPQNYHVSHLCHTKSCVNISHLSLEPPPRCKAVGAELHSSLVKRQLKNIQDRNDYHMTRKNSIKYKERQAVLRCARFSDQIVLMMKHHSFACVHHRESGLEVFAAKFQTLGLS
jgi:hypothetical protein